MNIGEAFFLSLQPCSSCSDIRQPKVMLGQQHESKGVFPFLWAPTGFLHQYIAKDWGTLAVATLMETTIAKTQMASQA